MRIGESSTGERHRATAGSCAPRLKCRVNHPPVKQRATDAALHRYGCRSLGPTGITAPPHISRMPRPADLPPGRSNSSSSTIAPATTAPGYRDWQQHTVTIARSPYHVATKPGVVAHGRSDVAAVLLAEHAAVNAGDTAVHMHCGNGLFGAVAAQRGAGRVLLVDRNVVAVDAARRTLALNGVTNAEVLLGHGAGRLPAGMEADIVAIRIPLEKRALLQLLHDAFAVLRVGGRCCLAGATNEGIKSAAALLERLFGNVAVLAHASGHRVVATTKRSAAYASAAGMDDPLLQADLFHEVSTTLRGHDLTIFSRPGVFSWDHVDEATAILADVMEVAPGQSVLDLGCGAGALGTVAGRLSRDGRVCMVDADVEAVRSATRTAADAGLTRAELHASDVAGAVLEQRFDVVVTNPPFHVGKATDLDVPLQFIHDAWTVLSPGGRLLLVANRTLPYERPIRWRFGNITTLHDGPRFKVLAATKGTDESAA